MPSDIVLIGPMKAGKSTVAGLLGERLHLPVRKLDELCWDYYRAVGFDDKIFTQLRGDENYWGINEYLKPFQAYAVERVLADYTNCIFDFGAGHSVYDEPKLKDWVRRALEPYPNCVLLLPSPDVSESIQLLALRGGSLKSSGIDLNAYAIQHPLNRELAKHIVYTQDKTPAETCAEILYRLGIPA